jgi:UDP-4-amino-4-deoxy-L-arabinose formyltransferase/UDP-glucuronic acid dehydrogenase (UDP-4-keto-hexauronic acid decarboxylating)
MSRRLKLVLIAEGAAGTESLRLLAGSGHAVTAVMTDDAPAGATGATVAGMASRLGYQVWPARQARVKEFGAVLQREEVDLLLNVQSPYILPQEVIAAPLLGSFNLHPGPLPRYAGRNAPSWAIYHREHTHEVTLHWMDQGINTGPVAYAAEIPLEDDDTGLTLSGKCIRAGLPLLHDLLTAAAHGEIPSRPQPPGIRRHYGDEVPHEGRLIWSHSAVSVVSFIRACDYTPFISPWRAPRAYLAGREIAVLKAALTGESSEGPPGLVGRKSGSEMLVSAGDEWVRVQRVQVGSSVFPAAEALRPGDRFALPPSNPHVSVGR